MTDQELPEDQPNELRPDESPKIQRGGKEIKGWRIRVYYWTRDPLLLFWVAAAIIGLGVLWGREIQPKRPEDVLDALMADQQDYIQKALKPPYPDADLAEELKEPQINFERVLGALLNGDISKPATIDATTRALTASRLGPAEKQVALAEWLSLSSPLREPSADLLYLAYYVHPPPYANELVGDYYAWIPRKLDRAVERYMKEVSVRPDAESARRKIIAIHWAKQNFAALENLRADPAYASLLPTKMLLKLIVLKHDWKSVWEPLFQLQAESFHDATPLILTALAAGVWLILAWQMVQATSLFSFRVVMTIPALLLGAASTMPVLFLAMYQDEMWGLRIQDRFFQDAWFFISGVSLREELCKMIAFLPLLPIFLIRKNRLEVLVIASCVGLGFAAEENVSYFRATVPALAFARFLTANFLHFASTGLIGLALFDAIRAPRQKLLRFIAIFAACILVHGCYDIFATVPGTGWLGKIFTGLTVTCVIFLSLAYFRQLARERGPATDQFFPGTTLVLGLSLLISAITILSSMDFGLKFAISMLLLFAIQTWFLAFIFFVLLRDGLKDDADVTPAVFEPVS